jgi:hypothetical protein
MSASEEVTEIVADVAEEVADQASHVAEVSRGLTGRDVSLVLGGIVVGAGLGAAATYFVLGRKLETKYEKMAAEEIAQMREHYHQKAVALEAEAGKGDLEELVRERGYIPEPDETAPPMAVTPPTAVVEAAEEAKEDEEAEVPPPAAEDPEPEVRNVFTEHAAPVEDEWDWHKERSQRSPMRPYVIHIDERDENDAYDAVTWTYYEQDDVVCDERDEVISPERREQVIGEANLEKFGHGSGDATTVYIRNDQLEMDVEVIQSPNSYAEEVHGFEPPELKHSDRRRRISFDDE